MIMRNPLVYVGSTGTNAKNQPFTIIEDKGMNKYSIRVFRIRFDNTGYERDVLKADIIQGQIKDRFEPSAFGIGYVGDCRKHSKKEINLWYNIMRRCYSTEDPSYQQYGARGVTMCDRWLCLQYFLEDIPFIEGYNEELFIKGELYLDKDYKQFGMPYNMRIYSKETCIFLSRQENNAYMNNGLGFGMIYPSGDISYYTNMEKCARENHISKAPIGDCLRGELDSYKDNRFMLRAMVRQPK